MSHVDGTITRASSGSADADEVSLPLGEIRLARIGLDEVGAEAIDYESFASCDMVETLDSHLAEWTEYLRVGAHVAADDSFAKEAVEQVLELSCKDGRAVEGCTRMNRERQAILARSPICSRRDRRRSACASPSHGPQGR